MQKLSSLSEAVVPGHLVLGGARVLVALVASLDVAQCCTQIALRERPRPPALQHHDLGEGLVHPYVGDGAFEGPGVRPGLPQLLLAKDMR